LERNIFSYSAKFSFFRVCLIGGVDMRRVDMEECENEFV